MKLAKTVLIFRTKRLDLCNNLLRPIYSSVEISDRIDTRKFLNIILDASDVYDKKTILAIYCFCSAAGRQKQTTRKTKTDAFLDPKNYQMSVLADSS